MTNDGAEAESAPVELAVIDGGIGGTLRRASQVSFAPVAEDDQCEALEAVCALSGGGVAFEDDARAVSKVRDAFVARAAGSPPSPSGQALDRRGPA